MRRLARKAAIALGLAAALWLLAAALAPAKARGGEPGDPPPQQQEDVYLTPAQALRQIFPADEAPVVERAELALTAGEKARVEERLHSRLFEDGFVVHRGRARDGSVAGYAIVTEEIGKYRPITFVVGVRPDATVREVAVMVYRESHGSDVKRRRFLAQFDGKGLSDDIRQNKDIINVSGATLSVRSVTRGVRKVLNVVDEVLLGPRKRTAPLDWHAEPALGPAAPAAPAAPPGVKTGLAAPLRRAVYLMGTVLEVTAYPDSQDEVAADRALGAAFAEVARLEALMTTFRPESELSRVNREAALRPVPVSADTLACVTAAIDFARRSGGAFDPTLRADGWTRVRLDAAARTIAFAGEGPLALDLGGIAKGYALDRAAEVLRARGLRRALLNFGGQILALDPPPGAPAWIVAVEDPAAPDARAMGYFEAANASVSTSSQLERPGHILDPRTGAAARASVSATVLASSATAADALSTAVFVLGPERGRALAATEPGTRTLVRGAAE